jgi:hypothetical protein
MELKECYCAWKEIHQPLLLDNIMGEIDKISGRHSQELLLFCTSRSGIMIIKQFTSENDKQTIIIMVNVYYASGGNAKKP